MGTRLGSTLEPSSDGLEPPWPDLLIASGRVSVPYAIAIRRLAAGRSFTVQIQDPRVAPGRFDLVVPPRHDHVNGANVIPTLGGLTRITPARLAAAAAEFSAALADLPRPLVAVLIGGSSAAYRMTPAAVTELAGQLGTLRAGGAGLAVTVSRRTGPQAAGYLREALAGEGVYFWDGVGANPYFGYLALADAIVVTADSVSMTSEACSTGKPVYVAALPGGSAKFREFHATLVSEGYAQPFVGALQPFAARRFDETARIAGEIKRRLGL